MTALTPMWAIARREIAAYFKSAIAYVALAVFVLIVGAMTFQDGLFMTTVDRDDAFVSAMFGRAIPLGFWLFAPAIAMRLIAEERGSGTIAMLLTMPVRDRDVVLGKLLAALAVLAVALAATAPFTWAASTIADLDGGVIASAYLGAVLLGALYLAAGLFASSLCTQQISAFLLGLLLCFAFFALLWFVSPSDLGGSALLYATPSFHYENLTRGLVELRTLVYFVSAAAIFVFLALQAVEARKWR